MNRQAENAVGLAFGDREGAALVTEFARGGLQMNRHGVVHRRADAAFAQIRAQRFAPFGLHDERVVDLAFARRVAWQHEFRNVREQAAIACRVRAPGVGPRFEMVELHEQDRGLQCVEPRVDRPFGTVVACLQAEVAQNAQPGCELLVVGGDDAAVAACVECLERMEAEAAEGADRADLLAVELGQDRLRRVFHDRELVLRRDGEDAFHVRGAAREMHRHDGLRARRDRSFDLVRIDVVGCIDVDEHRHSAGQTNARRRCDEGVGRRDHLIARADVERAQRELQRVGPVAATDGVAHADQRREALFERLHRPAEDEVTAFEHALDGGQDLGFQRRVLRRQVDVGYRVRTDSGHARTVRETTRRERRASGRDRSPDRAPFSERGRTSRAPH